MSAYFLYLQFNMYFNSLKPHFIMGFSNGVFRIHKYRKHLFSIVTGIVQDAQYTGLRAYALTYRLQHAYAAKYPHSLNSKQSKK